MPLRVLWWTTAFSYNSCSEKHGMKIIDSRPDALKIEAAGFDTKTSFRKTKD